ncbi:putative ArsR family transcriptional regulator [Actinoplanes octamycinicus]|uniref:Putative ArsR family transcriptional regulator n=1 Tax=Actinoplanes octamycinicus TaxID=135948 RepID=A0A7W7GRD2_9ACTN|nr:transcriptional regulator [Actinoplanes octamycinicus]MBB4736911.1 putative ArsR family transcriptional regulator [Actinoplanes octamycinicus]GIE63348.1 ArsR family transcriptional regulator [Actinoplanes octamycinicus]
MTTSEDLDDLDALTTLADGVRRRAYRVVADGAGPVGRDEVAEALGIGRTLAAFHLDKLVAAGLLATSYARRSGRTGPGAGRPAKLYHLAPAEHAVSVPPRAYRTAAELLAEALDETGAENVLNEVARRHGQRAAADKTAHGQRTATGESEDVQELLTGHGYAPTAAGHPDRIELRNCPFHRLAEQFPPVICGMNLAMINGLLAGAGLDAAWTARMDAAPGRCCVSLSKTKTD